MIHAYQKYRLIIPFLLPAILLYGVFVVWPYAQAIYISLTSWRGVSANKPWVGLDNYQRLWEDERFHEALTRNGQLLIVLPLVTIAIALTFAALFTQGSQQIRGAGFYRIVFFFPQIISAVIVGILWSYVYTPNIGLLNGILRAVGLGYVSTSWLTNPTTILWAIAAVAIWSSVGFYMVIYIASMQSIPTSFYEAAILDGATRWTSVQGHHLPIDLGDDPHLGHLPGDRRPRFLHPHRRRDRWQHDHGRPPRRGRRALPLQPGVRRSRWGYASAIGVVLLILTLLLSVVIMRLTRRETYEF